MGVPPFFRVEVFRAFVAHGGTPFQVLINHSLYSFALISHILHIDIVFSFDFSGEVYYKIRLEDPNGNRK